MSSPNVGFATLQVIPSARDFGRKLSGDVDPQMTRAGRQSGRRFGNVWASSTLAPMRAIGGAALALFGVQKVAGFLKGAVNEASGLAEAGNKINVVFGPATRDIMKYAAGGAKALGQSKLAVLDAAASFGVYGKAAGLTGPANAKFSKQLVGISTDLASFYNANPAEVVAALGSGLRGEAEPLRKFGVLLDDATLRQEALRQGLIKTTKQALTPQQKVLASHAVIMRQTRVAQGDFARTSGGLANQQRILSAQWSNAKAKIGAALLPAVTAVVRALNGLFDKFAGVKDRAKALFDLVVKGDFTKGFAKAFNVSEDSPIVGTLLRVRQNALKLIGAVQRLWTGTIRPFVADLRARAVPAAQQLAASFATKVLPVLRRAATYITTNVVPIVRTLAETFVTRVLPVLVDFSAFIWTKVMPVIVKTYAAIARNLTPVLTALADTFRTHVLPALLRAWERLETWLPTIKRVIGVVVKVTSWLLRLASSILGKVLPPLVRFAGFLLGRVIGAISTVIGWVERIVRWVLDFGTTLRRAGLAAGVFALRVRKKIEGVFTFFRELPGKIKGFFADAGKWLVDAGKEIIGGLLRGITDKFGDVKDFVVGIGPWIKDHKGPLSYDRRLLVPAGRAVMGGLDGGLRDGFASVRRTIGDATALVGSVAAPHRAPALTATPASGTTAAGPLVGSLTLQSRGSVHNDLEETMFMLRRLARGGVHAPR